MMNFQMMGITLSTRTHNHLGLPGDWVWFETRDSYAEIVVFDDPPRFLLHWIESGRKGDGSLLLDAIAQWADAVGLRGMLTCTGDLVGFYTRYGWVHLGPWAVTMTDGRAVDTGMQNMERPTR